MKRKEITKELLDDIQAIYYSSTRDRITAEYNRERLKLKINKEEEYPKYYQIKTNSKNNWIIIVTKDPLVKKFQGTGDCVLEPLMYYYNRHGINVLHTTSDDKITLYYEHLFDRFRQRMGLNIPDILDVVKLYFTTNYSLYYNYLPQQDGSVKILGIVKDGFVYGDLDQVDDWCVNKTFISNKTANYKSTNAEKEFLEQVKICMNFIDKVKNKELLLNLREVYATFIPEKEKIPVVKTVPPSAPLIDFKLPVIDKTVPDFVSFIKNNS